VTAQDDNRRRVAQAALEVLDGAQAPGGHCLVSISARGRMKAHPEIYETKDAAASAGRARKSAEPTSEQMVVFAGTRALWVFGTGGAVLGSFDRSRLQKPAARRRRTS